MNSKLVKFLSSLVIGKRQRWMFRNRMMIAAVRRDNKIEIAEEDIPLCRLKVDGKNNRVKVGRLASRGTVIDIRIFGDGNEVVIGDSLWVSKSLQIVVGQNHPNFGAVSGCTVRIGERTGMESCQIVTYNSGATIEVGSECMFSFDVILYNTDGHPIVDRDTGAVINRVGTLKVGNHCWLGAGVTILKNTTIPDDCIVGWRSVVSGKFTRSHCAIAGNPAVTLTKAGRNISWCPGCSDYINNQHGMLP